MGAGVGSAGEAPLGRTIVPGKVSTADEPSLELSAGPPYRQGAREGPAEPFFPDFQAFFGLLGGSVAA